MSTSFHRQFTPWLRASAASYQGSERKTMEDRLIMTPAGNGYLFAVCDGHGGAQVAENITRRLKDVASDRLASGSVRRGLADVFQDLQCEVAQLSSGSTLSLVFVTHDRQVWVANVGDSSVYGLNERVTNKLSVDHKVTRKEERERVLAHKGFSIDPDGYVIAPCGSGVNMTRSLGEREFLPALSAQPFVHQLRVPYTMLVIASDGIWDVISPKTLRERLYSDQKKGSWKTAAARFNDWRNKTYKQHDNTSIIVISLDQH